MAGQRDPTDGRLDELYRARPERFVAGRDALAKELRAAGERERADEVAKLRRPTAAAALLNRAVLTEPETAAELADATAALEAAQSKALERGEGGAGWRRAAERERRAAEAIVVAGESAARAAGEPASPQALERARETLRAAAGDPELRERLLAGRLEREASGATLGTPAAAVARRKRPGRERERDRTAARRELERLERELAEAEARRERLERRVGETKEALRRERAKLAEAKREESALRRRVGAGRRRRG